MKSKKFEILLCFSLITFTPVGHTAGISAIKINSTKNLDSAKVSLIEKTLNDQKIKGETLPNNSLKVLRSMNVAPTQNFFAVQNQRFTRFIQSFFSQTNS